MRPMSPVSLLPTAAMRPAIIVLKERPPINYRWRRRRVMWLMFALSFLPYFWPEEYQPAIYQKPTSEDLSSRLRERRMRRFLGGDIRNAGLGDLFGNITAPPEETLLHNSKM